MIRQTILPTLTAATLATFAGAEHIDFYTVDFDPLNGSNVTGNAILTHDTTANTLRVQINGQNIEPGQDHLMHIHGLIGGSGQALDSQSPTLADDSDGDGFIEVLEGVPQYGDILLPLGSVNDATGIFTYDQTFDLTDDTQFLSPVSGNQYSASDLFPLNFREIVIHGKTVATGPGLGTGGEVDGTGGYKAVLPVAAGEIVGQPIPEPGSLALLGLGGLLLSRRRR